MSLFTVTFDSESSQSESYSCSARGSSINTKSKSIPFSNSIHEPLSKYSGEISTDTGELIVKKRPDIPNRTGNSQYSTPKLNQRRSPRSRMPVKQKNIARESENLKENNKSVSEDIDEIKIKEPPKEEHFSESKKLRRITNEDEHLEEEEYHESVYRVERINTFTITGPKRHFRMLCGGKPILFTNVISRLSPECLHIFAGIESKDETKTHLGTISHSDEVKFKLELDDGMTATIKFARSDIRSPRIVACRINTNKQGSLHLDLISKKPKLYPSGQWTISFGHVRTIASIKNCILEDLQGNEYAKIFKVDDDALHVIANDVVQPPVAFFIAVANFISRT